MKRAKGERIVTRDMQANALFWAAFGVAPTHGSWPSGRINIFRGPLTVLVSREEWLVHDNAREVTGASPECTLLAWAKANDAVEYLCCMRAMYYREIDRFVSLSRGER